MADATEDRLYRLLPEIYRSRDVDQGEPLRALLRIVQGQSDLLEADIRQLWDDFFVETCEPWVIPYIGDLVGTLPLFDAGRVEEGRTAEELFFDLRGPRLTPEVALRNRADVAKTIYYRRRKGTLPMLEELARDVTGWGAHAAEMFARLGWTQCVRNHVRPDAFRTPDLRNPAALDLLDGPFDTAAHTVDVRPISQLEGWYGIRNVAFFLWRLRSYAVERSAARRVGAPGDFRYHVSPLGNPAPLFTRWRREGDEAGLATELHVPGPIRPAAFYENPGNFYGLFDILPGPDGQAPVPDSSLMIFSAGTPVPVEKIRCADLSTWPLSPPADPDVVAVDVRLGRIAFGANWVPPALKGADVFYHYGFSADLGGGPYPRGAWQVKRPLAEQVLRVDQSGVTPGSFTTINAALTAWVNGGRKKAILSILDSRTYDEAITIEPADGGFLAIEAADGQRPHLKTGELKITGFHPKGAVTFSGLLIEGWLHVTGSLGKLRLLHSTLVPGRGLDGDGLPLSTYESLIAESGPGPDGKERNDELRVEIAFSITGPLRVPRLSTGLWVLDSIVDGLGTPAVAAPGGADPAAPAWLERSTFLGAVHVQELPFASEAIFTGPAVAERRQEGCVRFSYLPEGSQVPRRYRCQPDLEIQARTEAAEEAKGAALSLTERNALRAEVSGWLAPSFTSARYGQPAYAQLHLSCPRQIAAGAADGSEMGAFCHLKQPQREANLRLRLEEYLPFGLEPGFVYAT